MLIETYNIARQSEFLQGVHCEFGKIKLTMPTTNPSVIWIPMDEEMLGAQFVEEFIAVDGKDFKKEEIARRKSNCALYLFERTYEGLEALINRVSNAILFACVETWQNGGIDSGEFLDRAELSENTVGYMFKMHVIIPIFRLEQRYIISSKQTNVTPVEA